MFEKITESDITKNGVSALATTPTRPTAFGESAMSAADLKARFDKLPRLIADKVNEILTGIEDGQLAEVLNISNGEEKHSVSEILLNLLNGNVDEFKIQTLTRLVTLAELGAIVVRIDDDLKTGELARRFTVTDDVSLADFFEEIRAFTGSDVDKIADKVLERLCDVSQEGM